MVAVYLVKGSSLSVLSWDGEREPVLLERQRLDTLYVTVKAALVACTPPIVAPIETQTTAASNIDQAGARTCEATRDAPLDLQELSPPAEQRCQQPPKR